MRKTLAGAIVAFLLFALNTVMFAQQFPTRQDAIWARTVPSGTITLDGVLDEAAWDQAETININYGENAGLPTSGWKAEFQPEAITDPTHAQVKFLIQDNQLFLGFIIPDSSIGGTEDWARWDGILMSVKNKDSQERPIPPFEYFYTWWMAGLPDPTPIVGAPPRFIGTFGNFNDTTRTPEQVDAWDARTVVNGTSNDAGRDESWVVEMKVDLTVLGYDVTSSKGDVVELNFSIWDCDYLFEGDPARINTMRTWWQSPWGNANANNVARIYARPDVTVDTDPLPEIEPDVLIPNGVNFPMPTIDGVLDEDVWQGAYTFDIAWDDSVVRASYPGIGPYMSGQFQPELNGNPRPPILDPSFGTFKIFFKDNYLYVGADVNDQLVQGTEVFDAIDGIALTIGDRNALVPEDNQMEVRYLRISFGADGEAHPYDYLPTLIDTSGAEFAAHLKGSTTVNNNTDIDEGFSIELKIDLTKLGYPSDLGDRLLFVGAMLADGDSFDDSLNNYGSRTWWFREHAGGPAITWSYLDPDLVVGVENESLPTIPNTIILYGNYPNPFNPSTTIKYSIPEAGDVNITIFNSLGQEVTSSTTRNLSAGVQQFNFDASNLASGVYLYKVKLLNSKGKNRLVSKAGKMLLIK